MSISTSTMLRILHQTPDAQMDTPKNITTDQKAKTLAAYRLELDQSAYAVVLHELYDTINYSSDTLRIWVRNMDNIGAEFWIADSWLASGNVQQAIATLDAIQQQFALTSIQSADLQKYREVTMLLQNDPIDELKTSFFFTGFKRWPQQY